MRTLLALLVVVSGSLLPFSIPGSAQAANHSLTASRATASTAYAVADPGRLDILRQKLPTKVPARVKKMTVPDLNPLIDQLMRHAELDSKATKIMPWVYSSCEELLVADYEDAVVNLDSAGIHLQAAMQHLIEKSHESVATDHAIVLAKLEIDQAEYTILFLLELATLEL